MQRDPALAGNGFDQLVEHLRVHLGKSTRAKKSNLQSERFNEMVSGRASAIFENTDQWLFKGRASILLKGLFGM